jgi:hypothetical protein
LFLGGGERLDLEQIELLHEGTQIAGEVDLGPDRIPSSRVIAPQSQLGGGGVGRPGPTGQNPCRGAPAENLNEILLGGIGRRDRLRAHGASVVSFSPRWRVGLVSYSFLASGDNPENAASLEKPS